MRLADLIREEREKRGLSKAELARRAGLSPSAITRLEKGEVIGRSDSIARIARVLGIPSETIQSSLAQEGTEERDIQLIDLSKIPPRDRGRARRMIQDIVRNFEEEEQKG